MIMDGPGGHLLLLVGVMVRAHTFTNGERR